MPAAAWCDALTAFSRRLCRLEKRWLKARTAVSICARPVSIC